MEQRSQARNSRAQQPSRARSTARRSSSRQQSYQARHSRQQPQRPSRAQGRPQQRRAPQRQQPQRSGNGLVIGIIIAVVVCLVLGITLYLTQCRGSNDQQNTEQTQTENTQASNTSEGSGTQVDDENGDDTENADKDEQAVDADSWELTLVNKNHPLPEDWDIELAEVADGKYVDARIAEQFTQMIDDCRAAGFDDVYVNQAYRSHEDQQAIWDEFYSTNIAQGYSEDEAYALTLESVAIPGNSEHELGLAADICSAYFDEDYNAPIQTWLRENGHKYGFIQRYPAGKEDITGVKNENWHFRYVGVEAATEMYESGQVLEEYLGVTD